MFVSEAPVGYDFLAIDIQPPLISSIFQVTDTFGLLGR
jgi:hypothetical protein